jgi:hypothetical protein
MAFINTKQFTAQVKKDIAEKIISKAFSYELKANNIVKDAIEDMEAVDTGLMQSKSFAKLVVRKTSNTPIIVKAKAQSSKYAIYVHEGLGTNRRYGRRPFLESALKQFLDFIKSGSYSKDIRSGSPNKRGRSTARIVQTGLKTNPKS